MEGSTESLKRRAPSLPLDESESSSKRSASEGPSGDASSSDPRSGLEDLSLDTPPNIHYSQPPVDEKEVILHHVHRRLVKGDLWYFIPRTWFRAWEHIHTGELSRQEVGVLDTSSIVDSSNNIRSELKIDVDYTPIHQQGWDLLTSWYATNGPAVSRRAVPESSNSSSCIIELSPPEIHLFLISNTASSDSSKPEIFSISAASPYKELIDKATKAFLLPDTRPVRLWRISDSHSQHTLGYLYPSQLASDDYLVEDGIDLDESSDLRDAVLSGKVINLAIEQQNEDGDWIATPPSSSSSSSSSKESSQPPPFANNFYNNMTGTSAIPYQPAQNGPITRSKGMLYNSSRKTGLNNLGNTCYMNSALQCLANFPELRKYFLSGVYCKELNREAENGSRGQVAEAFAELMEQLSRGMDSYPPRRFKQVFGRIHDIFAGYGQQDSQEFVYFLLDAIHEDLNRVVNKLNYKSPDYTGGGDEELIQMSNTAETQYKTRDNSFIDDLLLFYFINKISCLDCHKVAYQFSADRLLALSFPSKKWIGHFFVVPIDPSRPRLKVHLEVSEKTLYSEVKKLVGEKVGIDGSKLAAYEVYASKFFKEKYDGETIEDTSPQNDMIVLYEVGIDFKQARGRFVSSEDSEDIVVPVFNAIRPAKNGKARSMYNRSRLEYFGAPFLLTLSPDDVKDEKRIRKLVSVQYSRYCLDPDDLTDELEEDLGDMSETTPTTASSRDEKQSTDSSSVDGEASAQQSDSSSRTSNNQYKYANFNIFVSKKPSRLRKVFADSQAYSPDDLVSISESVVEDETEEDTSPIQVKRFPGAFGGDDEDDIYNDESNNTTNGNLEGEEKEEKNETESMDVDEKEEATKEDSTMEAVEDTVKPVIGAGYSIVCYWSSAASKTHFGLDLKGKFEEMEEVGEKGKHKNSFTLNDFFDLYTEEQFTTWNCPGCKENKKTSQKIDLWSAPDTLVIMLKRYANSYRKVSDYVDFPLTGLDLSDRLHKRKTLERLLEKYPDNEEYASALETESAIYDLFGVVNHAGGLGGGHYTADCKDLDEDKWYNFNDSMVTPVADPERVKTSSAYVLFYRRRTSRPLGGKTMDIVNAALENAKAGNLEPTSETTTSSASPVPPLEDDDNSMKNIMPLGMESLQTNGTGTYSSDLSDDGAEAGSDDSSENIIDQGRREHKDQWPESERDDMMGVQGESL